MNIGIGELIRIVIFIVIVIFVVAVATDRQ